MRLAGRKTNETGLFVFGWEDLAVWVENRKSESRCEQRSFDYLGENHSLCSNGGREKTSFTPKRFIFIQMK